MATIFMSWELGGGLGHVVRLSTLARALAARGHRLVVALRDLAHAHRLFADADVIAVQAPVRTRVPVDPVRRPATFAHILHNVGFGSADDLFVMARAWRQVFEWARPDLILFDHSPTALLAAHGAPPCRRALIGTGFCCPPPVSPLPNLRPGSGASVVADAAAAQFLADEQRVLAACNAALSRLGQPPMDYLMQMYDEVDDTLLTTVRELDHYPERPNAPHYWATRGGFPGRAPEWPPGPGERIFAYLKPFKHLPEVLASIRRLGLPTVVHVEPAPRGLVEAFSGSSVRIESEPVDVTAAAAECRLAILNGTHASTLTALLAGRPTLQLPIYLEQAMCAAAVGRLGAGLAAPHAQPQRVERQLRALLSSASHAEAAAAFAARYRGLDDGAEWGRLAGRIHELVERPKPRSPFR